VGRFVQWLDIRRLGIDFDVNLVLDRGLDRNVVRDHDLDRGHDRDHGLGLVSERIELGQRDLDRRELERELQRFEHDR